MTTPARRNTRRPASAVDRAVEAQARKVVRAADALVEKNDGDVRAAEAEACERREAANRGTEANHFAAVAAHLGRRLDQEGR